MTEYNDRKVERRLRSMEYRLEALEQTSPAPAPKREPSTYEALLIPARPTWGVAHQNGRRNRSCCGSAS